MAQCWAGQCPSESYRSTSGPPGDVYKWFCAPKVAKGYILLTSSIGTGISCCHSFWDGLHGRLRHCTSAGAAPTFQAVGTILILLGCRFPRGSHYGVSPWRRNGGKSNMCKGGRHICRRCGSPAHHSYLRLQYDFSPLWFPDLIQRYAIVYVYMT